jgi:hypothetical protein
MDTARDDIRLPSRKAHRDRLIHQGLICDSLKVSQVSVLSLGGNYETQRENASNSTQGTRNETLVIITRKLDIIIPDHH